MSLDNRDKGCLGTFNVDRIVMFVRKYVERRKAPHEILNIQVLCLVYCYSFKIMSSNLSSIYLISLSSICISVCICVRAHMTEDNL